MAENQDMLVARQIVEPGGNLPQGDVPAALDPADLDLVGFTHVEQRHAVRRGGKQAGSFFNRDLGGGGRSRGRVDGRDGARHRVAGGLDFPDGRVGPAERTSGIARNFQGPELLRQRVEQEQAPAQRPAEVEQVFDGLQGLQAADHPA